MANITVSTPVHNFLRSSRKRDMQDLLSIPLPFAAFTHTLTQSEWRKAAKFTSTKSTNVVRVLLTTTTGYARILNYDGTWQAVAGTGAPSAQFAVESKTPPTDGRPSFYAVIPCDASGNVDGDITGELSLAGNSLTSVDVTGLSSLTVIYLGNSRLTSFDGTGLSSLIALCLSNNLLTSVDVTGLSSLTDLYLNNNLLTSFDGTGLSSLDQLFLQNNQLTSFDGTGLSSLTNLDVTNNQIASFLVGDLQLEDRYNYYTALTLSNQQLDAAALQVIYNDLPDGNSYGSYNNTLNVTGNPGAGAGSGTDPSVATSKGWTIVGDVV